MMEFCDEHLKGANIPNHQLDAHFRFIVGKYSDKMTETSRS